MQQLRVDFHVHTHYSPDSTLSPAALVRRARAAGLDRVAVTDHNRMEGAWEAAALDPALIIPGEEIDCADGSDLIGLFLRETIPAGLPVAEVAARIREQGGVVYAPHPYAYLKQAVQRAAHVLAVADIVEVHNARAFLSPWNRRALKAAKAAGLSCAASTDAHFGREIGGAFTLLPAFQNAAELLRALPHAQPVSVRMPSPFIHFASFGVELVKRPARWLQSANAGGTAGRPAGRDARPRTELSASQAVR
jgi:predicted metal-dependent phosphoesterase TrpH